jgi:methylmalonyl-CoA mutase, N-terminal domain
LNRYTKDQPPSSPELPDYTALEQQQRTRLSALKQRRSAPVVDQALNSLRQAAGGTDRLMPVIVEAVKARATLGEISDTLRSVWGVYRPQ